MFWPCSFYDSWREEDSVHASLVCAPKRIDNFLVPFWRAATCWFKEACPTPSNPITFIPGINCLNSVSATSGACPVSHLLGETTSLCIFNFFCCTVEILNTSCRNCVFVGGLRCLSSSLCEQCPLKVCWRGRTCVEFCGISLVELCLHLWRWTWSSWPQVPTDSFSQFSLDFFKSKFEIKIFKRIVLSL